MTRSTPSVHENRLHFDPANQEKELEVGSQAWFAWLQQETSSIFAFHAPDGFTYTARKESAGNRLGGWYWKAYRKQQGRLYRAYMGKAEDLSSARLHEIALLLAEHVRQAQTSTQAESAVQPQRRAAPAMTPVLASRLRPPRLANLLIERSRLLTLLDSGEGQKLTLIQAPAGFGKTTLVTRWLAGRQGREVAWISLDDGDNDSLRFWSALITACQVFDERIGQAALASLAPSSHFSPAQSSLENTLALLLNELDDFVRAGVLVLEDYHLIEQPRIHETLAFFIEHLPPSLRVILLTRSTPPLPLVRWRARGDVLDIQQSQLRFSPGETATFLSQVTKQTISEETVNALHRQLEGWAAGLRLLSLSLQGQETPRAIETYLALAPSASASARPYRPAEEYFLSEVLASQPEALQLFLLQTSLFTRLSASLCDAVTGQPDSAAWLELAARSGFFLEALDYTGEWYRYHTLFAEAMRGEARRRLGEERLHRLSALASRWYEEHTMPVEAIEAALTAHEFERAGQLIESFNEHTYFTEYHTMRRWLEQLPAPHLRAHPMLCFLLAQARIFCEDSDSPVWRLEPVEDLLLLAEEGWRKTDQTDLIGILYAFRATFTIVHGLTAPAVVYARKALQDLPPFDLAQARQRPAEWIEWRCGCLIALSQEALLRGAFSTIQRYLQTAYALSLHNADHVFTLMLGQMLGDVCLELGELHQAASYYQQTFQQAPWQGGRGADIMYANTISGLSRIHYERNELNKAEQLLQEAARYNYSGDFSFGEEYAHMRVDLLRFRLLHLRGATDEVRALLSTLLVRLQSIPQGFLLVADVLFWQARWHLRNGEVNAAEHIRETLTREVRELSPLQAQELQILQARLHLTGGEAQKALPLLEALLIPARQEGMIMRAWEIQLLCALALAALKREEEAHQQLTSLLAQTRGEGLLRLFLDEGEPVAALLRGLLPACTEKPLRVYVQSLLHTFAAPFSEPGTHAASPLLEPLSGQEQRVLALLVAGRSNQEIAQELVVSVNTVKGHVKNIYRKLNVNTRVQASEAARQLHLL